MARKNDAWGSSKRWGKAPEPLKNLSLLDQYKRLAQRADKRLQRLEKKFGQAGYEGLENWAYARAMRDIKSWSGEKGTRFGTKIPKFDNAAAQERYIKGKIADINRFLQADTSTVTGGIQSSGLTPLEKAAKTFSKSYGAKVTWQQLGAYYESDLAKEMSKQYGSKTIAKALGRFKRMADAGRNAAEEMTKNPKQRLSSNKMVDEVMKKMIAGGFNPSQIFNVKENLTGKGRRKKK